MSMYMILGLSGSLEPSLNSSREALKIVCGAPQVHTHFSEDASGRTRPLEEQAIYPRIQMCCALAMFYCAQARPHPNS